MPTEEEFQALSQKVDALLQGDRARLIAIEFAISQILRDSHSSIDLTKDSSRVRSRS